MLRFLESTTLRDLVSIIPVLMFIVETQLPAIFFFFFV